MMRSLGFVVLYLLLSLSPASAIFAQFLILDAQNCAGEQAKFRPSLKVNTKNPNFVDVRIPHHDDGRAYWLVIATDALQDEALEFRSIAWGSRMPDTIESFSRLGESVDLWSGDAKPRGYIEFSIHRRVLKRCYVYHDYDVPLDDGGFYYTYKLSGFGVVQDGENRPSNAPESVERGDRTSGAESKK